MFPKRYFCNEAFAPRYFAKVGAEPVPIDYFMGLTTQRLLTGAGA